jgi:hypothetical protein
VNFRLAALWKLLNSYCDRFAYRIINLRPYDAGDSTVQKSILPCLVNV